MVFRPLPILREGPKPPALLPGNSHRWQTTSAWPGQSRHRVDVPPGLHNYRKLAGSGWTTAQMATNSRCRGSTPRTAQPPSPLATGSDVDAHAPQLRQASRTRSESYSPLKATTPTVSDSEPSPEAGRW